MKQFIVTVKHDTGKTRIRTAADDKETASKLVMASEGCPQSAILSVREAMYYKKSLEEKNQDKQDKKEDKAFNQDIDKLTKKGAILSDFQE